MRGYQREKMARGSLMEEAVSGRTKPEIGTASTIAEANRNLKAATWPESRERDATRKRARLNASVSTLVRLF